MAVKRIVDTNFWNDEKVVEQFSPEDKLFMLYLLTNPHTKQLGIYAINKRNMAFELGYSIETISVLLERFENKYKMVKYSEETREIAIKNYLKYSIIKGGKPVEDCLEKEIKEVKDKELLKYIFNNLVDYNNLNETVNNIINKHNEILNDNDNERIVHESSTNRQNTIKFEQEFEELWKLYPKKRGKDKSLEKYIKARKDGTSYEDVLKGLNNYKEYIEKTNTHYQFIKDGSTWFNQKCWNDEYIVEEQPKKETEQEWFERMEKEAKEMEKNGYKRS